jgi:hypothetical protein
MPDTRTAKLIAARQRASRDKRAHTLHTLDRLLQSGARISFAAVAREADVSTWLVYNNPELKQAITDAMKHPARHAGPPRPAESPTSQASLRTDLELARHEIAALRRSERKLRERLQRTLGAEIEHIDRSELVARRIDDLETVVAKLRCENNDLVETNTRLTQLADQRHDDLDTANTLLRRYMKEASRAQAEPI